MRKKRSDDFIFFYVSNMVSVSIGIAIGVTWWMWGIQN